jgi:6-phosphofructokinase 1
VAYDRSLATAFGVKAVRLAEEKKYGVMTALKGKRIAAVPLHEVENKVKTVDLSIYRVAAIFFG